MVIIMQIRLIFGTFILILLACNIGVLAFLPIPDSNQDSFTQISGSVQTLAGLIIGYYFGTSDGSRRKTEMMDNQNRQATGKASDPVYIENDSSIGTQDKEDN